LDYRRNISHRVDECEQTAHSDNDSARPHNTSADPPTFSAFQDLAQHFLGIDSRATYANSGPDLRHWSYSVLEQRVPGTGTPNVDGS
jgi:hypothetical protein